MKVVILAGGYGTRLSEETHLIPKPMVEIGGKPIICHIMTHYANYGFKDFIILLGYKGYVIKEYFVNYYLHNSNIKVHLNNNNIEYDHQGNEDWTVQLIDTGLNTMTGGRIKRVQPYISDSGFFLTYGDGLSDVDINLLLEVHKTKNTICTLTGVQTPGRFGNLTMDGNGYVTNFEEKPKGIGNWINGGFFVCNKDVFSYIDNDATIFEQESLQNLAKNKELSIYKHTGFWQCMDTPRDKAYLNKLWDEDKVPWKT